MKSFAALSLLLAGAVSAQTVSSKPFDLVIESSNNTLNGQKLSACHSGAAIESLCLAGNPGSQYYMNTTKGQEAPIKGTTPSGTLIWNLPIGNGKNNRNDLHKHCDII